MKRIIILCLWILITLQAAACARPARQEMQTESAAQQMQIADGIYGLDSFSFTGGSGKVSITCEQIRVEDGQVLADIVFDSRHYQYVKVGDTSYDPVESFPGTEKGEDKEAVSRFEIPVRLQADNEISGMTTAMSQPHEIAYTLHIGSLISKDSQDANTAQAETGSEEAEADRRSLPAFTPSDFPSLIYEYSMETQYAQCFAVHYFKDGYKLLETAGGGRFLLSGQGGPKPEQIPADVTFLGKTPSNIYLAATAVMSFFEAAGAEDAVTMTGTDRNGWQIEGPVKALQEGKMTYMGKYNQPDYEGLTAAGCDLAIESTMILHVPEVEEKIKELGIPVLIDHSSYEPEPLGRTEWIRFYGALMDCEEEADAIFSREASYAQELGQKENSGKKIAYFAVNSGKTVDVRGGEDYIVKMIRQAGGIYAFDGLSGVDGMTASVSISLEEFYACAADADYLVYNASIQEPLSSVSDLTAAYPLLEDLKAVQEGHVFQVRKSLYQSSVTGCRLITDLAKMMAGEEDSGMTFLEKVGE